MIKDDISLFNHLMYFSNIVVANLTTFILLKKENTMLNKISDFFNNFLNIEEHKAGNSLSIEIACAVLLCEVMRADSVFTDNEQDELSAILTKQFNLTAAEVETILEQAFELSENASDFYQFTSKLNQHYSIEERIEIVTLLWQVAYADGELASIEEHIIRKIADLLHLRHTEYIATKIAAKQLAS
jgi:uncharacterized tellurite resistance protein B-like protein